MVEFSVTGGGLQVDTDQLLRSRGTRSNTERGTVRFLKVEECHECNGVGGAGGVVGKKSLKFWKRLWEPKIATLVNVHEHGRTLALVAVGCNRIARAFAPFEDIPTAEAAE
jgi:hypothetical protein